MNTKVNNILLSVIIVSYNCLSCIEVLLKSIEKYNDIGDKLEIIVVDNSSNEETINWLKNKTNVIAIKNCNKGFGEANNVGAKIAKGEYLLFLNPDTILVEPVFKFAVSKLMTEEDLGCFGLQLTDVYGCENISYYFRKLPKGIVSRIFACLIMKLNLFLPRLMYPSGANIFIKKSVFFKCGMFDEKIFMYFEEPDLCNRLNKIGKRVAFYKEKKIIHLEGKASSFSNFEKEKKLLLSYRYYCKKYDINFKKELFSDLLYFNCYSFFAKLINTEKYISYNKRIKYIKELLELK